MELMFRVTKQRMGGSTKGQAKYTERKMRFIIRASVDLIVKTT